jgi:hypothetical protein
MQFSRNQDGNSERCQWHHKTIKVSEYVTSIFTLEHETNYLGTDY